MAAVMIGCQKVVHYESRLFANIKKDVANDGLWQRLTSGVIVLIKNILFPQKRKTKFLSLSVCHHDFFLQSGNRKTINVWVLVPLILDIKVIEFLEKRIKIVVKKIGGQKSECSCICKWFSLNWKVA